MSSLTKTIQSALLALQSVAASSVVVGSAVDVSTRLSAMVHARFGRRSATAAGAGANIRIEASRAASGNNTWFPLATLTSAFAACEGEAVNGTCNSGQAVVPVASTANLTAGDVVFIDNTTIADSEWGRVKAISSNASVTLEDDLVNAQTGASLYDAAEIYAPIYVPEGVTRLRAVADGSLFTQAWAVEVSLTTVDSIG